MSEGAISRPETRYGHPSPSPGSRRFVSLVLTVLAIVAGIAVALVGYQRLGSSDVEGKLAGYHLVDDESASVTISVTRSDPSRPVVCIVRVRSKDGSETGRREVLVPPSEQDTIQVTTTVKSSKPPVLGDVYGCGTDVPAYLRAS